MVDGFEQDENNDDFIGSRRFYVDDDDDDFLGAGKQFHRKLRTMALSKRENITMKIIS